MMIPPGTEVAAVSAMTCSGAITSGSIRGSAKPPA